MDKINKQRAERLYNEGKIISIIPCNTRLGNMWVEPFNIHKMLMRDGEPRTFTQWVNEYEYYNCNNEMGLYLHYYTKL